jgi:MoxR-like ATPase
MSSTVSDPTTTGNSTVARPLRVQAIGDAVLDELERVIVGKRSVLKLILAGVLADGHVLLEDNPGLAKTLVGRSLAQTLGLRFSRIQFTPDLLPADVTGGSVFNQHDTTFEFRPGPLFANLVLADEINRTPPKTQAALLEAMHERQITVDGTTHHLERPFLVIGTQNPIEHEGTYPLPEAQLDRFLLRTQIGYPSPDDEWEVLSRRIERRQDDAELSIVASKADVLDLQRSLELVHVDEAVGRYMVDLVRATRVEPQVEVGASPRGGLALLKLSRAWAALAGRDFVLPDDVKAIAIPALAHRLVLRSEAWVRRVRSEDVMRALLASVPVPPTQPG